MTTNLRPLREGELMAAYLDFDRHADKTLPPAEYLLRFGAAVSDATVKANTLTRDAEIERLRDLLDEQQRTIASLMVGMPEDGTTPVIRRIAGLEAEIERLRKDAERYRWLRDVSTETWMSFQLQWRMPAINCDAVIDKQIERT